MYIGSEDCVLTSVDIVPQVVPNVLGEAMPTSIWGDSIVTVPWDLYQVFGDKIMLGEQYQAARDWVDKGIVRNDVGLWNRKTFQFADWLDPKAPADSPGDATTDKFLVSDAYLLHSTKLLANISSALSFADNATTYSDQHAKLTKEFQKAWISSSGKMENETQTGLALPLFFELFSSPEHYDSALKRLVNIIQKNDFKVGTGFAGTHLLGHALSKYGASDTFYQMLLQKETPSWLYQVVMNATTTWERWDSMLPNGTVNPGEMTSFNHYAVGSVASWIHSIIGGINPAEPGYKKINIEPIPGGQLRRASARLQTSYGLVSTKWWLDDRSGQNCNGTNFHLVAQVPPNTRATIVLPASKGKKKESLEVGSGTHRYRVPCLQVN